MNQYTPPATDLSACATLTEGNLIQGGYTVLIIQCTSLTTDLSSYAPKSNPTFTGTLNAGAIAESSLSYVDNTTLVATDVMTQIQSLNTQWNNSKTITCRMRI